ncbi:GMC family oxidoreductase [Roseomonas sp. KE2513]|uniref:GMC family oxidoreductase n=1 Tax=Roseomonas sp. KE2513 TaxID=2479202 RepID=UPI0018DFC70F|nr:GMC family oxidoreductase [Roseomonas sp. KE2513]MBI0537994.1 GMC family oxidoreductase [Roseomonas sp. KE2513]
MPKADVVIVGMGWTGSIAARELAAEGLRVVGLERGGFRDTASDFPAPNVLDELKYSLRGALFQDLSRDALTFRNSPNEAALPMRRLGAFLLGEGLGGAGVHWNGQHFRFLPADFQMLSHNKQRYGDGAITDDMTIQDWGVTYEDMEPHYDRFEYLCGTSGKAGNLRGEIQEGGNPFEGARAREYPTPPMEMGLVQQRFMEGARKLGLKPYPQPSSNLSQDYTNPDGAQMQACTYCGHCERFGCYNWSKASPLTTVLPVALRNPNFELRLGSRVTRVELTPDKKHATGVVYVDALGRETRQPADMVLLCAFQIHNVRLMLLSGIGTPYDPATGQGQVGRNFSYQTVATARAFFEKERFNQFAGAGALGAIVDEFNGDNFDHGPHGFIGGGYIIGQNTGLRPIEQRVLPADSPRWGMAWKQANNKWYDHNVNVGVHAGSTSRRQNYISLDPTYTDDLGLPLARMTFDFSPNDLRMRSFMLARAEEIARAMNPDIVNTSAPPVPASVVPYQTTHICGGAIMGTDPSNSAVNKRLQSWDVPNVFSIGASAFPQNAGYNPTNTVGALTYLSLQGIKEGYLKNPGRLIDM